MVLTYYGTSGNPSYNDVMSGYRDALNQQNTFNQQTAKGYADIQNQISGIGQAQGITLGKQYAQASAANQQSMMNRGLYNTTVQDTAQRGDQYDYANAQISLANQLAQTRAGFSQAGLQAQQQGQGLYQNIYAQQNAYQQGVYQQGQQAAQQQALQEEQLRQQQSQFQQNLGFQYAGLNARNAPAGSVGFSTGGYGYGNGSHGNVGSYTSNMPGGGGNPYMTNGPGNYYGAGGNGSGGLDMGAYYGGGAGGSAGGGYFSGGGAEGGY